MHSRTEQHISGIKDIHNMAKKSIFQVLKTCIVGQNIHSRAEQHI